MGAVGQIADFVEKLCQTDDLDDRLLVPDASGDEARVIDGVNGFLDKLWLQGFELAAKHEMLEKVIEIRTNEVHEILDNVRTGFLITLNDESVLDNYSRSCVQIFGRDDLKGVRLSELLGFDDKQRAYFDMCFEAVFDDLLPVELTLAQLPSEFRLGEHIYRIRASPIANANGQVTKLFFTIDETTELRKAEAENALRLALLEILRQKEQFREFLYETSQAFAAAREAATQTAYRTLLHTLKGNLGCYGLHEIAQVIHGIEDAPEIGADHLAEVEGLLRKFVLVNRELLGFSYPEMARAVTTIEVDRVASFLAGLRSADEADRDRLIAEFEARLAWVPAEHLLAPLVRTAERVGARLEKPLDVRVVGEHVLVDPARCGPLFSNLVHLVRNSIDHGIEPRGERAGKPEVGHLVLACEETPTHWRVRVEDDGRGIDLEALGAAALRHGVVTAEELATLDDDGKLALMFREGVSTAQETTTISGRGVGGAAVWASARAAGARLRVRSAAGRGTAVEIEIPRRSAA